MMISSIHPKNDDIIRSEDDDIIIHPRVDDIILPWTNDDIINSSEE